MVCTLNCGFLSKGFPASDKSLHTFFTNLKPEETALSMQAFLTSLFLELESVIRREGLDVSTGLAPWLRHSMTDNQTFSQNKWRQAFYETVVRKAAVSALVFYPLRLNSPTHAETDACKTLDG